MKAAAVLHLDQLLAKELISKVVGNRNDLHQVRTALGVIGCLREYGAIADHQDGIVQLTPAALRAAALLTEIGGAR